MFFNILNSSNVLAMFQSRNTHKHPLDLVLMFVWTTELFLRVFGGVLWKTQNKDQASICYFHNDGRIQGGLLEEPVSVFRFIGNSETLSK